MQPYIVQPSKPNISTKSDVTHESHEMNPNQPPVTNAMDDSRLLFINNTDIPADPSPSHHNSHRPLPPSSQNAVTIQSKFPKPSWYIPAQKTQHQHSFTQCLKHGANGHLSITQQHWLETLCTTKTGWQHSGTPPHPILDRPKTAPTNMD